MMLSTQQVMAKSPPMILSSSERENQTKSSLKMTTNNFKFRAAILSFSASFDIKISNLAMKNAKYHRGKLTMILPVVISSGKAVVSISVWFWLVDESEWTLNRSANDCNFVGHPSSSSPNKQSDWPSHNQPAGIQPLLPLQWYSFSPQKSKRK